VRATQAKRGAFAINSTHATQLGLGNACKSIGQGNKVQILGVVAEASNIPLCGPRSVRRIGAQKAASAFEESFRFVAAVGLAHCLRVCLCCKGKYRCAHTNDLLLSSLCSLVEHLAAAFRDNDKDSDAVVLTKSGDTREYVYSCFVLGAAKRMARTGLLRPCLVCDGSFTQARFFRSSSGTLGPVRTTAVVAHRIALDPSAGVCKVLHPLLGCAST